MDCLTLKGQSVFSVLARVVEIDAKTTRKLLEQ
jgi:hypothetical protein